MPYLTWSARALVDLGRLDAFLQAKSPKAAARASTAILRSTALLKQFPDAGRPAERYGNGRREWPISLGNSGYIVLYEVRGDEVVIAAVRHQRERDYQP